MHAPDHPAKVTKGLLVLGASASVTWVPSGKLAVQVPGQLMPAGELVTVPMLCPWIATVSVRAPLLLLKVADTEALVFIGMTQDPVPVQAPLHPEKFEPAAGLADRVTCVPLL